MALKIRDSGFIVVIGAVLVMLLFNTGGEKPRTVPSDNKHKPFLDAVAKGKNREEVEKLCVTCHNARELPLPKNHPPKEQCLICHKAKGLGKYQ